MQVAGMISDTCTVLSSLLFCSCFNVRFFSRRFVKSGFRCIIIPIVITLPADLRFVFAQQPFSILRAHRIKDQLINYFEHLSRLLDIAWLFFASILELQHPYFIVYQFIRCDKCLANLIQPLFVAIRYIFNTFDFLQKFRHVIRGGIFS